MSNSNTKTIQSDGCDDLLITYPGSKEFHKVTEGGVTECDLPTEGKVVIDANNPLDVLFRQDTPEVKPCETCFEDDYQELHQLYLKGYTSVGIAKSTEELIAPLPWSVESEVE